MHLRLLPLVLAVLAGPLLVVASDAELRLLHRVYLPDPDAPEQPFVLRATIDASTRQLIPVPNVQSDLAQFYRDAKDNRNALYQLAFQNGPLASLTSEQLDISSVKACHIPLASADFLTLHLDSDGRPFHADYYLADVPSSGACPTNKQLRAFNFNQPVFLSPSNTTVRVRHATLPPLPELRVPPPLSPKGEPIAAVPEKSFIQKYWLYIIAALGLLLLTGGQAPEEEGAPSGGGDR